MARRNIYHGQPAASSAAVYTSTNNYTTITAATVQNTTAGAETLDVWFVENAGSVSDAKLIFEGLSVAANTSMGLPLLVAQTMDKNAELHLVASAGTSLTVKISGDIHG